MNVSGLNVGVNKNFDVVKSTDTSKVDSFFNEIVNKSAERNNSNKIDKNSKNNKSDKQLKNKENTTPKAEEETKDEAVQGTEAKVVVPNENLLIEMAYLNFNSSNMVVENVEETTPVLQVGNVEVLEMSENSQIGAELIAEEMPELKNSKEIIKTLEKSTQESAFVAKDDVLNENPQKVEAEKAVETSDISKEAVSKPVEMKVVKETSKLATEDVEVIQPQQTNLNKDVVVIKVGDVAQPESQQMFAEDLSEAIISKINSNIEQFNITLNPKDLGKIDVNIVVKSGVITVSLLCDNDTTKKLLTENLSSLTRNIEINTGQQAVVNIEKEDNSEALKYQDFDGRGNNSQQQQQERRNSEEKDVEDFIQKLKLGLVNFVEMEG